MLGFRDQNDVVDRLVTMLADPHSAKSWNLVIPPGFGHSRVTQILVEKLRGHSTRPLVAEVSADGLRTPSDLIHKLCYQWNLAETVSRFKRSEDPQRLLSSLLDTAGSTHKRIQVVTEFHKILAYLDERILVALRDAEQAGRLQTVAVSIYPHRWLREQWKDSGQLLHVSNYGDTHKLWEFEPCSFEDVLAVCLRENLPCGLVKMAYEWTGGYPEQFEGVITKWRFLGEPPLTPQVQEDLRAEAERSMYRLIRWMDYEGESRFRSMIVRIHQRSDNGRAYRELRKYHPWGAILLDESGLRADCLGDAAIKYEIENAFRSGQEETNAAACYQLAVDFYSVRQYDVVLRLLEKCDATHITPGSSMLRAHAKLMQALQDGPHPHGVIDTDWKRVRRLLVESRTVLNDALPTGRDRAMVEERYDGLDRLATSILNAVGNQGGSVRLIDDLAGMHGSTNDRAAAFTLMVLQAEAGRAIAGNSSACKAVLELPEQILRIWALWALGLNYYNVHGGDDDVWNVVAKEWPERLGAFRRPPAGQSFGGVVVFASFIRALCCCRGVAIPVGSPWCDAQDLQREMQLFDVRNDAAHATTLMNATRREQYFEHIDRWLDRIESDCPADNLSRRRALAIIEPLPLVGQTQPGVNMASSQ